MAFVRAVKSGNWSDPTVWHTNALPQNGDTVYSNNFTVTIDQDVLIGDTNNVLVNAGSFVAGCWYEVVEIGTTNFGSIGGSNTVGSIFLATGAGSGTGVAKTIATIVNRSNTAAGAIMGGTFTISGGTKNVWADLVSGDAGLLMSITNDSIVEIRGNINSPFGNGVATSDYILYSGTGALTFIGNITIQRGNGISKTSSGSLIIIGKVENTAGGWSRVPVRTSSTATGNVQIIGNVLAGGGNVGHGVWLENSPINLYLIIVGNVYGSRTFGTCYGIRLQGASRVTITGNVYGGTGNATADCAGISNEGGTVTIIGNCYAQSSCAVVAGSFISKNYFLGSIYDNQLNSSTALVVRHRAHISIPPNCIIQRAVNGTSTFVTYYTVDNSVFDYAAISDVRDGVSYANGNLVGTCKIPSPNNVTYNTPTDNTVGTAVLKPENVWDYLKNNIDTEGSIGERLKNAVTVNDMGKLLIDTLT